MYTAYFTSPLGDLELTANDEALLSVHFADAQKIIAPHRPATAAQSLILAQTIAELTEYFAGTRQVFTVPCALEGTPFRERVWHELTLIAYGATISYLELAKRLGDPKVIRAAGTANGKNPIAIIVPCHRVIGADGKMVGYGGDIWRKVWLLEHELKYTPQPMGTLF
jgi:methylated-DNA-[protein]-cysteine S-methyltransferase